MTGPSPSLECGVIEPTSQEMRENLKETQVDNRRVINVLRNNGISSSIKYPNYPSLPFSPNRHFSPSFKPSCTLSRAIRPCLLFCFIKRPSSLNTCTELENRLFFEDIIPCNSGARGFVPIMANFRHAYASQRRWDWRRLSKYK